MKEDIDVATKMLCSVWVLLVLYQCFHWQHLYLDTPKKKCIPIFNQKMKGARYTRVRVIL